LPVAVVNVIHDIMKKHHDKVRAGRVAEPVQVYLDSADRARLDRLTERLDTTKSDVLRRGLEALESLVRRPASRAPKPAALPVFEGGQLQPGVDLDDSAGLLDLMERDDASG
jgi:hypothetical protein